MIFLCSDTEGCVLSSTQVIGTFGCDFLMSLKALKVVKPVSGLPVMPFVDWAERVMVNNKMRRRKLFFIVLDVGMGKILSKRQVSGFKKHPSVSQVKMSYAAIFFSKVQLLF